VDVAVTHRSEDGVSVITVTGEIDIATAPTLREHVAQVVETSGSDLIIDLSAVDFIDSTGLGVIVGAYKKVGEREGSLSVVSGQELVRRLFSITGLDDVIPIMATLDEAIAAGPQPAAAALAED
jgi:anti-sigma B factor antagonist